MRILLDFLSDLVNIINEMSPYLLLGFLFAGILHVYFPKQKVYTHMGGNSIRAVINAALIGIPLPLCSCGVIPTGISFYRHGASKGSTVSFLISTPQTGIDSVLVTYSMLGLPFALIRPVVALSTGLLGGLFTNLLHRREKAIIPDDPLHQENLPVNGKRNYKVREIFRYAFLEFMQDISKYLVIGLLIAAVISVLIPDDFFTAFIGNDFLSMLVILVAAIPVYLCATASVPVAAVLMLKGLSPGAALVLLMAGPATNAATITLIKKVLGTRSLFAYLLTITAGALAFGVIINQLLPRSWFLIGDVLSHGVAHDHGFLPSWLKTGSSILLVFLIIHSYIRRFSRLAGTRRENTPESPKPAPDIVVTKEISVEGMTCNHCKQNVENRLRSVTGISDARADISTGKVIVTGNRIDLELVKSSVESAGYRYAGEQE